jgi:hypothetical protein
VEFIFEHERASARVITADRFGPVVIAARAGAVGCLRALLARDVDAADFPRAFSGAARELQPECLHALFPRPDTENRGPGARAQFQDLAVSASLLVCVMASPSATAGSPAADCIDLLCDSLDPPHLVEAVCRAVSVEAARRSWLVVARFIDDYARRSRGSAQFDRARDIPRIAVAFGAAELGAPGRRFAIQVNAHMQERDVGDSLHEVLGLGADAGLFHGFPAETEPVEDDEIIRRIFPNGPGARPKSYSDLLGFSVV